MKKTLIGLAILMPMLGFGQGNGGISSENTTTKIEWIGHSPTGQYIVKVTNKQSCEVNMRVQWGGTNQFRQKQIGPNNSDTFHIEALPIPRCFLGAKPETSCLGQTDLGTVELNVCIILPVKFKRVACTRLCLRSIKLEFEVEESSNIRQYNIQVSLNNGISYRTISILIPEGKTYYETTINL